MKNIAFLIVSYFFLSCSNVTSKEKEWIFFYTKDSIPKELNHKLQQYYGNFEIADFNQRFSSTDLLLDSLPTRKIEMLARKENHWRMIYVQGGFAKYYVLIDCHIDSNSISDFRTAETVINIKNNDSIDNLLKTNKLKFK